MKLSAILNIAMIFGILAVADVFIPWYLGKEYDYTAVLLEILTPVILLSGIGTLIRSQILIPSDREKEYTYSIVCGALVNFALNFWFILKLHAIGACITTIVAHFIVMVYQIICTRREYNYRLFFVNLIPYAITGLLMALLLNWIKSMTSSLLPVVRLCVLVFAGIIFYCVMSCLIMRFFDRDPSTRRVLKMITKK